MLRKIHLTSSLTHYTDDDDYRYYMKTIQIISEIFIYMTFLENTVVRATTYPEIGTSSLDWPQK
jgi:hypothetical protein